jgi:hypothetical protein
MMFWLYLGTLLRVDSRPGRAPRIVLAMNPLRRVLEAVGLKPKTRKRRLSGLTGSVARRRRRG